MKRKMIKKMMAAMAAAALITVTSVPALASESVVEATNSFGVTYTVDYVQGAANIGGRRIYFGFDSNSTYVRACGWKGGVGLRAREIADLMSFEPEWWARWSVQYPTVEQWLSWRG